jgi:hypothetical protein
MSALWQGFVGFLKYVGQMLFDVSATPADENCDWTWRILVIASRQSEQRTHFFETCYRRVISQVELIVSAPQAG